MRIASLARRFAATRYNSLLTVVAARHFAMRVARCIKKVAQSLAYIKNNSYLRPRVNPGQYPGQYPGQISINHFN